MEKKEFLTPEQRKGLLYGSLISAILGGGAALKSGGDFKSALGGGVMSASQAFGGGLEEIAKYKHQEIEEAKIEEATRASQDASALAKKKYGLEEKEHEQRRLIGKAALEKGEREKTAEADEMKRLTEFLAAQQPQPIGSGEMGGVVMPKPAVTPEQSAILQALGPKNAPAGLQAILKPTTGFDTYYDVLTKQLTKTGKSEQPPQGTVTPAMVIAEEKAKAAAEQPAIAEKAKAPEREKERKHEETEKEKDRIARAKIEADKIKAEKEKAAEAAKVKEAVAKPKKTIINKSTSELKQIDKDDSFDPEVWGDVSVAGGWAQRLYNRKMRSTVGTTPTAPSHVGKKPLAKF